MSCLIKIYSAYKVSFFLSLILRGYKGSKIRFPLVGNQLFGILYSRAITGSLMEWTFMVIVYMGCEMYALWYKCK